MKKGWMYILKCFDNSYYTGSTSNIEIRLAQHKAGEGANHTKKRLPVELVYLEEFHRVDEAFYREKQVQGWSRKKKEALINEMPETLHQLAKCMNETTHVGFDSVVECGFTHSTTASERSLSGVETKENGASAPLSRLNPELRFEGNEVDWKKSKMRDISTINQGLQISISNRFKSKIPNSYFYITNEFLKEGAKTEYYIQNPPESVLCTEEDILMTRTGNTGEVVTDVNGAFHNNFFKIKYDSDIDKSFLVSFLRSERTQKLIGELAGVSTIPDLNHSDFYSIEIYHPSKNEQSQIGSFFKNIDELISKHQKKHNRLVTLKKSMLEKMFPKEGQTVPEIRFKGFNENWKSIELGHLCRVAKSGGTPTSTNKEYYNGTIPFLAISDMSSQGKYLTYTSKSISQEGIDNSAAWIIPINTIVYSMYASVGFVSINKLPIATSQAVINLVLKDNMNVEFIYYFLTYYQKYIHKLIETGTQGNLNADTVKSLNINLPHINEQIKIGEYFKNLDQLIENHQKQLQKLKKIKQSLSEKMFV